MWVLQMGVCDVTSPGASDSTRLDEQFGFVELSSPNVQSEEETFTGFLPWYCFRNVRFSLRVSGESWVPSPKTLSHVAPPVVEKF